jgi:hypothetical protein
MFYDTLIINKIWKNGPGKRFQKNIFADFFPPAVSKLTVHQKSLLGSTESIRTIIIKGVTVFLS